MIISKIEIQSNQENMHFFAEVIYHTLHGGPLNILNTFIFLKWDLFFPCFSGFYKPILILQNYLSSGVKTDRFIVESDPIFLNTTI